MSGTLHLKALGQCSPKGVRGQGAGPTVPEVLEQGLWEEQWGGGDMEGEGGIVVWDT